MTLPILLSVPHAGLLVPPDLEARCLLTPEDVAADGDVFAREIYDLGDEVAVLVSTEIARAVLDMNRAEDDLRKDGVVKAHTCWEVPVWSAPLGTDEIEGLLSRYHRPYHSRLSAGARQGVVVGVDGHTMAAVGPPVGPDSGCVRPSACVSNGEGTCPREWVEGLASELRQTLNGEVWINQPFRGGYVIRSHASELPWVQLELSRGLKGGVEAVREAVRDALRIWCKRFVG